MREFSDGNEILSQTMRTHLIHDLDKFGVWSNDYQTFLNERAKAVSEAIKSRIIIQKEEPPTPNVGEPLHTFRYTKGMKPPTGLIRPDMQVGIKSWVDV